MRWSVWAWAASSSIRSSRRPRGPSPWSWWVNRIPNWRPASGQGFSATLAPVRASSSSPSPRSRLRPPANCARSPPPPYFQGRIGSRVGPRLAELERSQWLSLDELAARQWRKVRVLLDHAAGGVPFYRRLFCELGAPPQDIRTPEDLQALPVLSKQIIRERQQELLAAGNFRLMRRTTSGSTGIPMGGFTDFGCRDWTLAAIRRERRWWGIDVGDRDARLTTARRSRRDWLRRYYLLNQAEFRCVELSAGAMTHLYQE